MVKPFYTRTVVVTNEALGAPSGYEGDVINYTATIEDDKGDSMPATFVAELMMNGTELASVAFEVSIYDQGTHAFGVDFTVPFVDLGGDFTVKITSGDQII